MKKLRAAIIGCGRIAAIYKTALEHMRDEVEVVLAIDKLPERAQAFASDFPCCRAAGPLSPQEAGAALREAKADIVHILLPHHLHCEYTIAALKADIAVLTEKPIALHPEDADRMIAASEESGCPLGVIYQNRFIDGVARVRSLMESGELGEVRGAFSTLNWFRPASYYECDWKGRWATEGGGVVIDQAIHSIDLVRYMTGLEAVKVQAHTARRILTTIEVEDEADAAITLSNGAVYSFFACNYYMTNSPIRVEVSFEKATALLTQEDLELRWADGRTERILSTAPATGSLSYWGACHEKQLRVCYDALRAGKPLLWTPQDARKTLEIVEAIYTSARIHSPVVLA